MHSDNCTHSFFSAKTWLLAGCLLTALTAVAQNKPAQKPMAKNAHPAAIKKPAPPIAVLTVNRERLVEISTPYGKMIARLYDSTPGHRDNFVKLVQEKFYDSLLFHRVISGFMIQGGDPTSKNAPDSVQLGSGAAPGPTIPAEFKSNIIHKKGVLAAARDNNPEKASSNCQFYIVQGKTFDTAQMRQVFEQRVKPTLANGFTYTAAQKEIYRRLGGTPHLDQNYTVFGEVISGLDVIDRIAAVPTRPGDRPVNNVWMTIRLLN